MKSQAEALDMIQHMLYDTDLIKAADAIRQQPGLLLPWHQTAATAAWQRIRRATRDSDDYGIAASRHEAECCAASVVANLCGGWVSPPAVRGAEQALVHHARMLAGMDSLARMMQIMGRV